MYPKKQSGKINLPTNPSQLTQNGKKLWVIVGVAALLPIVVMMAFTFKSGFVPSKVRAGQDNIVTLRTPMQLADSATDALRKNDNELFNDLLDNEIRDNVNIVNNRGDTLLITAVSVGNLPAVQRLLASGADVNKANSYTKDTPVIRALLGSNDAITRLLVFSDADLNAQNNYNQSPMSLAIDKQKGEFIDLFLTNGVKAGLNKDTLFRSAASKNFIGVVAMLKGGVDPNAKDAKGNTPLIISSSLGDIRSVREMLAYRANVNIANKTGDTALMYAARYNRVPVVKALLTPQLMQYAIDVDKQNAQGQTALYLAAMNGYREPIVRLLAAGANAGIKAKNGQTALDVAKQNRRKEAIPALSMKLEDAKNEVLRLDEASRVRQEAAAAKAAKPPVQPAKKPAK